MIQQQATVLWNRPVGCDYYHLALACAGGFSEAVAGQFVMVQVGPSRDPLLRRPFSIFGLLDVAAGGPGIELLYRVVGRGTALLSQAAPQQPVSLLGPLGHGFTIVPEHRLFYLAAGGIGVPPIRFLARQLLEKGMAAHACHVFLGGRSRRDLLCADEFLGMGMTVTQTTDDGSAGDRCLVTDPLETAVSSRRPDHIYACGPSGMLQCVAGIAARHEVACQVSVESMMACGMGACLGCALHPADAGAQKYLHVCMDGPVFDSRRILMPSPPK